MNVVIMMLGTTSTLWERGPWLGRLGNAAFPAWHIEVRTMKRSKMTAAKNSLSPTMKSRARNETCHSRRRSSRRIGAATIGGQHTKISATGSQLRD